MIKIEFTQNERDRLYEGFTKHPHQKVRMKMQVLYLKSMGLAHGQIIKICRITKATLSSYLKAYKEKGIGGLTGSKYGGQASKLNEYSGEVKKKFEEDPPSTIAEARQRIFELTGILRSLTQIRVFLKRIGMRRLKTGSLPGGHKGNTEQKRREQKKFVDQDLKPRLGEARKGERVVLFTDAAHFVHGAFMSFVWAFTRIFIGTPPGRKRYNVLGAINAVSMKLSMVTNESYINAKSVCELLKKLYLEYWDQPVTLVLDNARYQKCKLVRRYAKILGIELLYLPSYSPQLNLIERLWKFVKKKVLHGNYYASFEDFKNALKNFLDNLSYSKQQLKTLLSWNFQSFDKVQILA